MSPIRRFALSFIHPILLFSLLIALLSACRPMPPPSTLDEPAGEEAQGESAATNTTTAQTSSPFTSAQLHDLVVLHTNDTWGYYDPCG